MYGYLQEFDLDEGADGKMEVSWTDGHRPRSDSNKEKARIFFRSQIRRLQRMKNVGEFQFEELGMSRNEWDAIWNFVDANIVAMTTALESLGPSPDSIDIAPTDGVCSSSSQVCEGSHYDSLMYEHDYLPYAQDTCEFKKWMKHYKKNFAVLESTDTTYQKLRFNSNPERDDICME